MSPGKKDLPDRAAIPAQLSSVVVSRIRAWLSDPELNGPSQRLAGGASQRLDSLSHLRDRIRHVEHGHIGAVDQVGIQTFNQHRLHFFCRIRPAPLIQTGCS